MSRAASGGRIIAPTAPPDITIASAMPRRATNQLETARVYAICAVPLPTIPSTKNVAYNCQRCGVSSDNDAKAQPKTIRQGRMMRLGFNRSSRYPRGGEHTATVIAAMPNEAETASRDHENSSVNGFRKTPKV